MREMNGKHRQVGSSHVCTFYSKASKRIWKAVSSHKILNIHSLYIDAKENILHPITQLKGRLTCPWLFPITKQIRPLPTEARRRCEYFVYYSNTIIIYSICIWIYRSVDLHFLPRTCSTSGVCNTHKEEHHIDFIVFSCQGKCGSVFCMWLDNTKPLFLISFMRIFQRLHFWRYTKLQYVFILILDSRIYSTSKSATIIKLDPII